MILDGQNTFSALSTGDSPTTQTDNASANYIDQCVSGLPAFRGEGGAYVAPLIVVMCAAAFTSAASGTIQAVLQDAVCTSTTNSTPTGWADIMTGSVFATNALPAAGQPLLVGRVPYTARRFLRVVYRVGTGALNGGTAIAFLTLDTDVVDQALRNTTFAQFTQSGQVSEAVTNSVELS